MIVEAGMSSRSLCCHRGLRWLFLLGPLGVSACMHWHTEKVAPVTLIDSVAPARVRLTLRDTVRSGGPAVQVLRHAPPSGAARPVQVVLDAPRVHGDSIAGLGSAERPISIALQDVTKVERRTFSWGHTVALVLTPVALFFGFACLYACGW